MKYIFCLGFYLLTISGFSQENEFLLKAKIIGQDSIPVENTYVINYRTQNAYLTRENGQFNIWVRQGDSLMISHISFFRKKVCVDSLIQYPVVRIYYDTIPIKQVVVNDRMMKNFEKNMEFLKILSVAESERMYMGNNPVMKSVIENNPIFSSQAASLNLLPILTIPYLYINYRVHMEKLRVQKGFHFYKDEEDRRKRKQRN